MHIISIKFTWCFCFQKRGLNEISLQCLSSLRTPGHPGRVGQHSRDSRKPVCSPRASAGAVRRSAHSHWPETQAALCCQQANGLVTDDREQAVKTALSKCPVCDGELTVTRLHCDCLL